MKVWERWKQNDPINLLDDLSENLKKIGYLYLDCGVNDEFNLHLGTKSFSQKCHNLGINHEYLTFVGGHFNTNYRFDISLPKIYKELK
jgi:S-formylglutathione hydrolase FrmB